MRVRHCDIRPVPAVRHLIRRHVIFGKGIGNVMAIIKAVIIRFPRVKIITEDMLKDTCPARFFREDKFVACLLPVLHKVHRNAARAFPVLVVRIVPLLPDIDLERHDANLDIIPVDVGMRFTADAVDLCCVKVNVVVGVRVMVRV